MYSIVLLYIYNYRHYKTLRVYQDATSRSIKILIDPIYIVLLYIYVTSKSSSSSLTFKKIAVVV